MATRNPHAVPHRAHGAHQLAFIVRPLTALRARRALKEARREADAELLLRPAPSLRLAWRAAELVVPKKRRQLARSLRRTVRDADPRYLPGAVPINRRAVRAAAGTLLAMADRLEELDAPVAPRGVLLVEQLLLDGGGPLYHPDRGDELIEAIARASAALELP